jgi:hypothetical protein
MSLESKRNMTIPGYIHPETPSGNEGKIYKIFKGKKPKKGDKGVPVGNNYIRIDSTPVNDSCPTCEELCVLTCPCGHSDKTCSNGHVWYTDRGGTLKIGNPH